MSDYDTISTAVDRAIKTALNRMDDGKLNTKDLEILGGMRADLTRKIAELEAEKDVLNSYLGGDRDIYS